MRATPDSPRMFESDIFDFFTRTPWWTVPLIWLPVSAGLFAWGLAENHVGIGQGLTLTVAGWFTWTLTEYSLHRTTFHWWPRSRFHFFVHGVHHEWPDDRYRLVMPPAVSLILASAFGLGFLAVAGPVKFPSFYAGFLFGYMIYDCTHYATHHLKLKLPVFQALKKHHLLHHFSPRHQDRKYGVSTTFWDHAFRTW